MQCTRPRDGSNNVFVGGGAGRGADTLGYSAGAGGGRVMGGAASRAVVRTVPRLSPVLGSRQRGRDPATTTASTPAPAAVSVAGGRSCGRGGVPPTTATCRAISIPPAGKRCCATPAPPFPPTAVPPGPF